MSDPTDAILAQRADGVLRLAQPDDLPAACAIAVAAWQPIFDTYLELVGEEIWRRGIRGLDWRERKADQVRRHFATHPEWSWVMVRTDGTVVGFLTFRIDHEAGIGVIGNNAVDPACQGQGWATFGYRALLAWFRDQGLRVATVGTGLDDGHAPARRAYEAAGFNRAVPHVDYWLDLNDLPD